MSEQAHLDVLERLLSNFARHATPHQDQQLTRAVEASPTLAARLSSLATSGVLVGIFLEEAKPGSPFLGTVEGGRILLAPTLLARIASTGVHVPLGAEYLHTNNLTFVLGALAVHLEPAASSHGLAHEINSFAKVQIRQAARALVHGWNYVVDSAIHENRGRPLTELQLVMLMGNLRYREAFDSSGAVNLRRSPSGEIELSEENLDVMTERLSRTSLLDIGAPPQISQVNQPALDLTKLRTLQAEAPSNEVKLEIRSGQTTQGHDAVSLSIGKKFITLDPAQLLSLVQQLAGYRAKMQPAAPYEKPKSGESMPVIQNPETTVNHSFISSSVIVSFGHPGLGRVSLSFSKELANAFHKAVGNQLAKLASDESSDLQ